MRATWEEGVTQKIADTLSISYGDAAGIVQGQEFYMQQYWCMGRDEQETAEKILSTLAASA